MAKNTIAQAMKEFINKSIEQIENPLQPVLFSSLVDHFKSTLRKDKAQLEGVKEKNYHQNHHTEIHRDAGSKLSGCIR